jgi:hypothetical protein
MGQYRILEIPPAKGHFGYSDHTVNSFESDDKGI